MTHTPGPWEVGHYDKCRVWTVNDFSTQRLQIANCKYLDQQFGEDIREETRKQAEANARLIAAAPQLLEMLETCYGAIETLDNDALGNVPDKSPTEQGWYIRDELFHNIASIIRKAKGDA